MATFTDRIRFVVEAVTGGAESNLKGLRSEIAKAEGAGGKVKASFAGVGTFITQNVTLGLAGAATAIATFVANGAQRFGDMAREAGRLADTTGLATDEASRFLAVLRPLGVEGADLADILGNINSKAAEGRLAELGIQAEGSNERLKQVIELLGSISDETRRAQLASELLGEEGTRQLAPLIANAETLRDKLAAVSDVQVITEEERKRAADYDLAMRNLSTAWSDMSTELGQDLIPALTTVVDLLTKILELGQTLEQGGGLAGMLGFEIPEAIRPFIPFTDPSRDQVVNQEAQGVVSNATRAPAGTPGVNGFTPGTVNITNNYPPSTDGRETDKALQDYYKRNGGAP